MLQFMLTNNPEPSYVHQTNIMGIPPGCTDATWPSNCTVTATSGTPPGTADTTGDGLLYSVLDPLLSEYHSYFSSATPYAQLTEGQIATVLANQSAWSTAVTSTVPTVSVTETGGVVTLTNTGTTPVEVPISVPNGTTGGTTFLQSYGGQLSGWAPLAAGASLSLTESTAVLPPPPVIAPAGGASLGGGGALAVGGGSTVNPSPGSPSTAGTSHAPAFVNKPTATATAGKKFLFTVATSGYPFPKLSHSALPTGLRWTDEANGKASIWGVPLASSAGTTQVKLTASNAMGSSKQVLAISVERSPALGAWLLPAATAGKHYSSSAPAFGFPAPVIATTGLPSGLVLSFEGAGKATLSGVPAVGSEGVHHVKVTVSNALGQASTTYTFTVEGPPAITSKAKLTVAAGQAFSFKLSASGYPLATFSHSALPRGLKWAMKAGQPPTISGQLTAKQSGVHKVTITGQEPLWYRRDRS